MILNYFTYYSYRCLNQAIGSGAADLVPPEEEIEDSGISTPEIGTTSGSQPTKK
jgi:hypothetical protein